MTGTRFGEPAASTWSGDSLVANGDAGDGAASTGVSLAKVSLADKSVDCINHSTASWFSLFKGESAPADDDDDPFGLESMNRSDFFARGGCCLISFIDMEASAVVASSVLLSVVLLPLRSIIVWVYLGRGGGLFRDVRAKFPSKISFPEKMRGCVVRSPGASAGQKKHHTTKKHG